MALRWIERLPDPELVLPVIRPDFERSEVSVFVPVNDQAGPSTSILQSAPTITRDKQPRSFPRSWVGDEPCKMVWRRATDCDLHFDALTRLCSKVTRIGHSSSLVRMWVDEVNSESDQTFLRLIPDEFGNDHRVRTIPDGFCDLLIDRYGEEPRRRHAELIDEVEQLKVLKAATKGKGANETKALLDEQIAELETALNKVSTRPPIRPTTGRWGNYRKHEDHTKAITNRSGFDTDLLVLVADSGPRLAAESTLQVTSALRKTIMKNCIHPIPDWISGHMPSGSPLRNQVGHIAYIPLLSAGHQYSDGHLLGAAIIFPTSINRRERGETLRPLFQDKSGDPATITLKLGKLGLWSLVRRDWSESRVALDPETWTSYPAGSTAWATVTPIVLDRFPKTDRKQNHGEWHAEVSGLVAQSCKNIGLPAPESIQIGTTCWRAGIPRSIQKRRTLRGHAELQQTDAGLGNGFPAFPTKDGNGSKPQVHARLQFAEAVVGPVLLGAGRYLGYGLCLPLRDEQ